MQSQVFQMFPTPLYVNTYEGDLTEVVEYFNSQEMNPAMGGGYGEISKNSYVIDHPACTDLNKFFMSCFKDFATNVMRYSYKDLEFAQSWITYKQPGQFHKAHTHPNTLLAGVFYPSEDSGPNLILLDSVKERLEFPELRRKALEQYYYWKPDSVIVESKASGLPLTYELRKMGIPVINFTPSRGNDKHSRINAVAPLAARPRRTSVVSI